MTVTQLEAITKTKYRVFIDGQFAFVLYKGELSRYHLSEGAAITSQLFEQIKKEVILKRARLRAMHLLNDMDRTEEQLKKKLKQSEYPQDIIEQAIKYVKSFGYINDENYAKRFVESKKNLKSKKEIYGLLIQKGLDKNLIEEAMDACYESEDSLTAIEAVIRKKRYCPKTATEAEKQKMYACLARKGFRYEDIRQVIQVSEVNA